MSFVGFVIFVSLLISGFIFRRVAKQLDELVTGEGLLAHWAYSKDEWDRYTEAEYLRDKREKWLLFRMVAIIAGIVGVVFVILKHDAILITLGVVGGLILIIAFTAWLSIRSSYKQNILHPGDVYIGMSGALLGRKFHYWKLPNGFLRAAVIEEGNPPVVKLEYSSPSGKTQGEYTARFPIPHGHEEEAKQVLEQLTAEMQRKD
jgi:hypothetical protein